MLPIKAVFKFLWLTIRPISKVESTLGLVDVMNLIPYATLGISEIRNWVASWWSPFWLICIVGFLILIAGIKLQFKLLPRLQIVFDPKKYPRCKEGDGRTQRTVYRVGVRISGTKSIDAQVCMAQMDTISPKKEKGTSSVLPQALHPSHYQPGTKESTFKVNPGKDPKVFVNVAEWTPGEEIALSYHEPYKFSKAPVPGESRIHIPYFVPQHLYKIVLQANGENTGETTSKFRMGIEDGNFIMQKI